MGRSAIEQQRGEGRGGRAEALLSDPVIKKTMGREYGDKVDWFPAVVSI
jgi:hypothetical protein